MTLSPTPTLLLSLSLAAAVGALSYTLGAQSSSAKIASLEQVSASEREGRIKMQIQLAKNIEREKREKCAKDESGEANDNNSNYLPVALIGSITSPYSTRNGTPRQPALVPSARARLTLHKNIPKASLQSLQEFSHAWIIFHFHQNTNVHKSQFKGTIKPPRLNGVSVGVFSTRTPHRPAPVVNVEKGYVLFEGLDLVHGTPVIDIKPYVAFSDTPACLLNHSSSPSASTSSASHYAPSWVTKEVVDAEPLAVSAVSFTTNAELELAQVFNRLSKKAKASDGISLYPTVESFLEFVVDNLMLDFRSTRERNDPKLTEYRVTLCNVVVRYHFVEGVGGDGSDMIPSVCVTGAEVLRDDLAQPLNL
ncbi:TsaA-like domain-containing protein [Obelidium mucronatum]|nr:TsaA-like domain-containing protein [Obelidium mucronatum]